MKTSIAIAVIAAALLLPGLAGLAGLAGLVSAQETSWQTTRPQGWGSGYCQLESNRISLVVSPFYVDVVEEAVIGTRGDVNLGDPSTLEITGQFTLMKGAALRSLLLWNGSRILKAKLLDRKSADSAYQAVVNREIPRDPAIIEYLGNSVYRFRIYPVAINASRKIRILYSVPFILASQGPTFEVRTAFTAGAQLTPTQVPVDIAKAPGTTGSYIMAYGSTRKTIQFGSTYLVSYGDLVSRDSSYDYYYGWSYYSATMNPISIMPDTSLKIMAYTVKIDTGRTAGNYTAVYATPPDVVLASFQELAPTDHPSFEAKVILGNQAYITDFNDKGSIGAYLKSTIPWDSTIYWTVYNSKGKIALSYNQKCAPQTDSLTRSMLPLVWGAKYSLMEGTDNLGALFGFVDQKMSLLALERDTLCAADALVFAAKGVPVLKPGEIIIKPSNLPAVPPENVIFEFGTGVVSFFKGKLLAFEIAVKNRMLNVTFKTFRSGAVRVSLYDIGGRMVASWNNLQVAGNALALELPACAKGCMIVRVYSGNAMFQKTFVMVR